MSDENFGLPLDLTPPEPPPSRSRTNKARKARPPKKKTPPPTRAAAEQAEPATVHRRHERISENAGAAENYVLVATLELAVPLRIIEMASRTPEQRCAIAHRCSETIGSHGDDLQFGGRHCAEAFNALAEGLAVAAYAPGGVTFAGKHWCTEPHEGCDRKRNARPAAEER